MNEIDPDAKAWADEVFKKAIDEIMAQDIFEGARIEAGITWFLPNSVLVGQVRATLDRAAFRWVIAGNNVPTDHVDGQVADNPRDALKHFSLKWQLGAERVTEASKDDPKTGEHYRAKAKELQKQAEDLYELTEIGSLWSSD